MLQKIRRILSDPHSAYANLVHTRKTRRLLSRLSRIMCGNPSKLVEYFSEAKNEKELRNHLWSKRAEVETDAKTFPELVGTSKSSLNIELCEVLYSLVRAMKPKVLVETGVSLGFSSAYMLKAISKNQIGKLYSIDIPLLQKEDGISTRYTKGYAIPENLRGSWELIMGDAKLELPRLLSRLGSIDFFLHDSEHTQEQMTFEYNEAWEHLKLGGLLLSDDVNKMWSLAYIDYCKSKGAYYQVFSERLGVAIKT